MNARSAHHRPSLSTLAIGLLALIGLAAGAEENVAANLSFKLASGQTAKYQWTTVSATETLGKERGETFSIKADLTMTMNVLFKGMTPAGAGTKLGIRIENFSYSDKKSLGTDVGEIQGSKGKVKVIQNGKIVVDSDNDIGLEDVKAIQQSLKAIEEGEMSVTLEPNGKEIGEPVGERGVIETIKSNGAEGMMRLLPGREIKPGETWEDSQSIPSIATFKLAKPAVVHSTSTFKGWEAKEGKRLARIDIITAWDTADLQGDNGDGMLVLVSHVQGKGAGTCLFDPATGLFVEGAIEATSKYRIDGKKDEHVTGLDVIGSTKFSFKLIP